ncbi:MAG: hypothetical protein K8R99_08290 [Actinomycetia bacterium]|nr:hypothetical protein [Actinomycetes bacterium]
MASLALVALACNNAQQSDSPSSDASVFDSGRTAYGFFPVPPEATLDSVFQLFDDMRDHGDFVLIQHNTNWLDFVNGGEGESQTRTDLANQVELARSRNLDYIFVADALNGLNRTEFVGLPDGWEASFANPDVRRAYRNHVLWIVETFAPRYLGLGSEINTYMDAHPEDAPNFVSLYNEIYALVKAQSPTTQVFVSFQWEDLNNVVPQPGEGDREKFVPNWDEVEAFEPNLDLWVISTYPYVVFDDGADIPADYYTPLLSRTDKPLAIAEGGFSSQPVGSTHSTAAGQAAYLETVHAQLGSRLAFWTNTLLNDFAVTTDDPGLGVFAHSGLRESDGSAKPALAIWDAFRTGG